MSNIRSGVKAGDSDQPRQDPIEHFSDDQLVWPTDSNRHVAEELANFYDEHSRTFTSQKWPATI